MVESQQRTEITSKTIVAAWNQIIDTPDELLVELISETTERICRFKPETGLVQQFLAEHVPRIFGPPLEREMLPHRHLPTRIGPAPVTNQRVPEGRQDGPLPITLVPPRAEDFLKALLQAGHAWLKVSYDDGRKEVRRWDASRLSQTSNVMGSLRSRPEFRVGAWRARGISSLRLTIEYPSVS